MDLIALAFILVIVILSITIFMMFRRNRRARKRDHYINYSSDMNTSSLYEIINQVKEEEMREKIEDRRTIAPYDAVMQRRTDMNKVNVGRIYGYNEDIFWDEDEYDRFNAECRKNGCLPQEAFAANMRLAENAAKITLLLDEMIKIENSYNKSKSENVSRLELIRNVIGRMYI